MSGADSLRHPTPTCVLPFIVPAGAHARSIYLVGPSEILHFCLLGPHKLLRSGQLALAAAQLQVPLIPAADAGLSANSGLQAVEMCEGQKYEITALAAVGDNCCGAEDLPQQRP